MFSSDNIYECVWTIIQMVCTFASVGGVMSACVFVWVRACLCFTILCCCQLETSNTCILRRIIGKVHLYSFLHIVLFMYLQPSIKTPYGRYLKCNQIYHRLILFYSNATKLKRKLRTKESEDIKLQTVHILKTCVYLCARTTIIQ